MKPEREGYTGEEKAAILRRHLLEGVAVSDVCEEYGLRPAVFYRRQKQFFEEGVAVFQRGRDAETTRLRSEVWRLDVKLAKKDEVLGELMEEYVASRKRELGTP